MPMAVVEKWSAKVLDEGFVPFPKKLVRSLPQLYPGVEAIEEMSVLLAIVDFKRPNLTRFPSREYLSFLAGMSVETFNAALERLQKRGLIDVTVYDRDGGLDISLDGLLQKVETVTQPEAPS